MRAKKVGQIKKFLDSTGLHKTGKYTYRQLNNLYRQVKRWYNKTGDIVVTEGMLKHLKFLK